MEAVAKKIAKTNPGNSAKVSNGSFFKPAPASVPKTPLNIKPTFFKPAIQAPKTADAGVAAVADVEVSTNKINPEPASASVLKTPVNNKPTFFKPAIQAHKTVDDASITAVADAQVAASNINVEPVAASVAKTPVNTIPTFFKPAIQAPQTPEHAGIATVADAQITTNKINAEPAAASVLKTPVNIKPTFFKPAIHAPKTAEAGVAAVADVEVNTNKINAEPAPVSVSKTPVNIKPTFFKPAIQAPKTADDAGIAAVADAQITTNKNNAEPVPASVPKTPVNLNPAIQNPKTVDTPAKSDVPVNTANITIKPATPLLNKPVEVTQAIDQPVAEKDIQPSNQAAGNKQDQAVNNISSTNTVENKTAAAPVNRNNGIQTDGKAGPAQEKNDTAAETKPGLRFINAATTEKAFQGKIAKAGKLAKANATTKSAKAKITESQEAQNKPEAEQHSDSNEGQVMGYAAQPVSEKSKADSQNVLKNAIDEVMPKTLGEIRDFKSQGKGKHIGNAVSTQVKGDVGSVKSSFGGIGKTPAPAPAEKGKELPLPEDAAQVDPLNLGAGVIPQIEAQHLDTTDYLKQNDDLLKKEELPQEHLDMVDSGDLGEANKQRTQLKADAAEQPKEIKEAASNEHKQLDADMHTEEKHGRQEMAKHRQGKLKDTGENQKTTKSKLEKEREDVAKLINGKYETCQKSIISKLDSLEKNSLTRFDQGQAKATTDFENQVNSDIAEFKRKRYDEVGYLRRKYRQARDWLLGIDDFPEVSTAFAKAREAFEKAIDTLIGDITADNNKVIAECKAQLQATKDEIAGIVVKLKPALQSAGDLAMKDVEKKLNELNAEIDKRKDKMQQQLADKRQAAMKAIDSKIEKMKEKLSGALSIIGKLLLEAAKKFFKWALEKLGIDAEGFFNTLSKIGSAIKAIFKGPGKFFSNLIASIKGAISDFSANFKTYIIGALADWLMGAMGGTGIIIPKEFTVTSVLGMLMQALGLTWAFLRNKLIQLIGKEKVEWAEKKVDVIVKFATGNVEAIWEWIKDQANSLKETFIQGAKDWLMNTLVMKFTEWIASLLIPGGAIVRLIQGIYNLVMWFVNNIQKILRWVNAVVDSLANIAAGAISGAIGFIVNAMKIIIPVILDFFARLLNISGIVEAVKKIIDKIAAPIHAAINKFIDWVVGWVKKMFGKGKEEKKPETKDAVAKMDDTEIGKVVHFNDGEEEHELWIAVNGGNVEVMVASSKPKPVKQRIIEWRQKEKLDELSEEEKKKALELLSKAEGLNKGTLEHAGWSKKSLEKAEKEKTEAAIKDAKEKDDKVEKNEEELKGIMLQLFRLFKSYPLDEEGKRLVGILENMTGVGGAKGFAGTLKGSKIPAFREGLKTQAKRAEHYYSLKLLIQIEKKEEGTRIDLVIKSIIDENAKDKDGVIYVEVKHWTGWNGWSSIIRDQRYDQLQDQLEKYKQSGYLVQLEWKGEVPELVVQLCKKMSIKIVII